MDCIACPFEKAILNGSCECEKSISFSVAEHMGVCCSSSIACTNCRTLLELLRERSMFALKVTGTSSGLTFGKEMKVMIGGLKGLQQLLQPADKTNGRTTVKNIYALVLQAQHTYGALSSLPFQEIVKSVTAYRPRGRGARPS